jgi:hypothetical protein
MRSQLMARLAWIAFAALSFVLALGSAPPAVAATRHALFTAPNITNLMPGGGRIAWIQARPTGSCYSVWVRGDKRRVRHNLTGCRSLAFAANATAELLGTAATRVFWTEQSLGNSERDFATFTAGAVGSTRRIDQFTFFCGANGCGCGHVGRLPGLGAILGSDYLYPTLTYDGDPTDCVGGGGMILTGGSMRRGTATGHATIGSSPGASLVAAAMGRFAELPLVPGGPAQPAIEVRTAATGTLVRTISTGGLVEQLSMSREGVVAQVGAGGTNTLRRYNPKTGALIRSLSVRSTAVLINASGARALYRVGPNAIRTFNLKTGRTHALATIRNPFDIRLDGRLVAWIGSRDRVMGIMLPRLPV